MRLLVTGGAGFIGSEFVRARLRGTADEIVVLDKLTYSGDRERLADVESDRGLARRLRFVEGDIADASAVGPLVAESDAVVDFAAETHVDRSILDASAFVRTGVEGVRTLLEAVRAAGRSVRFLQVGTDEVYGSRDEGTSREVDPLEPRSPYAAIKAAGDLLALAYHVTHGLDVVVTRGPNTFGAYQHPEKLVPLLVTNALSGEPLPIYGDGLQERTWLPVEDHAAAIGSVLDRGASGTVYNIAGGRSRTNLSMAHAVLARLGRSPELIRHVPDRPGHDRRYAMDGRRLLDLGWAPTLNVDAALDATIDWYVEHETWWQRHRGEAWQGYYATQYGERLAAAEASRTSR